MPRGKPFTTAQKRLLVYHCIKLGETADESLDLILGACRAPSNRRSSICESSGANSER